MRTPTTEEIEAIKEKYKPYRRVELIEMDDPQAPPKGTIGVIMGVDDIGTVHVRWYTNSTLGALVLEKDKIKVLEDFESQPSIQKEGLLMESAMSIQEKYDDMVFSHHLNPDKIDAESRLDRLQNFSEWARKFENLYYDSSRYNDDFETLIGEFAEQLLKEEYTD